MQYDSFHFVLFLQNIYHPRTSESLPPNYNMPPDTRRRPELHQRIRVIRHDDVTGTGESRSELLIQQTSPNDNGTYYCEAVNKAASSVSNFTLHVTDSVDAPTILQVRIKQRLFLGKDNSSDEFALCSFVLPRTPLRSIGLFYIKQRQ